MQPRLREFSSTELRVRYDAAREEARQLRIENRRLVHSAAKAEAKYEQARQLLEVFAKKKKKAS